MVLRTGKISFKLAYCQLYFRTICKYSFRYTWNFPKIWPCMRISIRWL